MISASGHRFAVLVLYVGLSSFFRFFFAAILIGVSCDIDAPLLVPDNELFGLCSAETSCGCLSVCIDLRTQRAISRPSILKSPCLYVYYIEQGSSSQFGFLNSICSYFSLCASDLFLPPVFLCVSHLFCLRHHASALFFFIGHRSSVE